MAAAPAGTNHRREADVSTEDEMPATTVRLTPLEADAVAYVRAAESVSLAQMAARLGVGRMIAADVVRRLVSLGYLRVQNGIITT